MVIVQQWKIKHLYSSRHWMDDPELKLLGCLVLRRCSIVFFPHFDFSLSAPLKGGIPGLLENSTLEWAYAHFLTGNYLLFPRLWAHILLFILQVNINISTNFNGLSLSIASNTILYEINGKWMISVMLEEQCLSICTSCFLREVNDISQNNFSHLLFFFPAFLLVFLISEPSICTNVNNGNEETMWELAVETFALRGPARWGFPVKATNYENDHWKGQIICLLEWTF